MDTASRSRGRSGAHTGRAKIGYGNPCHSRYSRVYTAGHVEITERVTGGVPEVEESRGPRPRPLAELDDADLPPFLPGTVHWVRWLLRQLPPGNRVVLTQIFYQELFAIAPQVRGMFRQDMSAQEDRLLGALLAAADGMDQPGKVEEHLRRWGVRHRQRGVTDEMYVYVGLALMRAIRRLLVLIDAGKTLEESPLLNIDQITRLHSAWVAVYQWMAAVMIDAADKADRIDSNPEVLTREPKTPFYQAYQERKGVASVTPIRRHRRAIGE